MGIQLKPVDDIRAPGCTLFVMGIVLPAQSKPTSFTGITPQRSLGFLRDAGQHVRTLQLLRRLNLYSAEADV